jgi:hypothetical protein
MGRLGKALVVTLVALCAVNAAEARKRKHADKAHGEAPATPAGPTEPTAVKASMLSGAALAIRQLNVWRNNMPRLFKPGDKDEGSPLIVKAEIEAKGSAHDPVKILWRAKLVPEGGAPQDLQGLTVTVDGHEWKGDLVQGKTTWIELYSKGPSTIAPGTKVTLKIELHSKEEKGELEATTTVDRVD